MFSRPIPGLYELGAGCGDAWLVALCQIDTTGNTPEAVSERFMQEGVAERALTNWTNGVGVSAVGDQTDRRKPNTMFVQLRGVFGAHSCELLEPADLVIGLSQRVA